MGNKVQKAIWIAFDEPLSDKKWDMVHIVTVVNDFSGLMFNYEHVLQENTELETAPN